jgi:hypothetical protein
VAAPWAGAEPDGGSCGAVVLAPFSEQVLPEIQAAAVDPGGAASTAGDTTRSAPEADQLRGAGSPKVDRQPPPASGAGGSPVVSEGT